MMAKSFWHHYDINNLTQDYRKEKEELKETMALEVVSDGKNDKTEKEWLGICTQETMGRDMFCVPPSFVLIDNKYILSCIIIRSK